MKICDICNSRYDGDIPHYCKKCGKNLSSQIEKTDVLLFLSKLVKIIGIIGCLTMTLPGITFAISPLCIDGCIGGNYTIFDWIMIPVPIVFIIISYFIKKHFKKECLLNINK